MSRVRDLETDLDRLTARRVSLRAERDTEARFTALLHARAALLADLAARPLRPRYAARLARLVLDLSGGYRDDPGDTVIAILWKLAAHIASGPAKERKAA